MTSGALVRGFAGLVAVGLVVGVVQLSCIASERTVTARAAPFTEAVEPEIPISSEVDGGATAESSTLTF